MARGHLWLWLVTGAMANFNHHSFFSMAIAGICSLCLGIRLRTYFSLPAKAIRSFQLDSHPQTQELLVQPTTIDLGNVLDDL